MKTQCTPKQDVFLQSNQANFLYVAGVGAGKSHAGAYYKIKRAIKYPLAVGLIAANTYQQLNRTTLKKFTALLQSFGIAFVLNKKPPASWEVKSAFPDHEGILTMRNGRQEIVASLENYDSLRGIEIADGLLDETRDTAAEAIDVVLGRLRGFDHIYPGIKYQLRITTTPNGFDHVWEKFVKPATRLPDSGYVQASTRENTFVPGFADRLAAGYGRKLAEQEIDGQFISLTSGKAFTFNRDRNVSDAVQFNPLLPLYFSMDFNVSPLCGVVMQMDLTARKVWVLDEIYIPDNAQTREACRLFVDRWKNKETTVRLDGDIAGKHRDTRSQETDHSIMIQEVTTKDFKRVEHAWDFVPRGVFAGIQACNALLEPAAGPTRLLIHPKCENLIIDLEQAAFKPGTQEIDKTKKDRSHLTDGFRYPIQREFPVLEEKKAPTSFGSKGIFG